jgi:hypothetical protein
MSFNLTSIANGHLGALSLMVTLAIIVLSPDAFSGEEPPDLVTDRPTKAAHTVPTWFYNGLVRRHRLLPALAALILFDFYPLIVLFEFKLRG